MLRSARTRRLFLLATPKAGKSLATFSVAAEECLSMAACNQKRLPWIRNRARATRVSFIMSNFAGTSNFHQSPLSSSLGIRDTSQTSPTTGEVAPASMATSHAVRRRWQTSRHTPTECAIGVSTPIRSAQRNRQPLTMRLITSTISTSIPKPPLPGSSPWLRSPTPTARLLPLFPSVGQELLRIMPPYPPQHHLGL